MHRAHSAFPQEICPIFLGVVVEYPVFEIKRQKILNLDWCMQLQTHKRISSSQWVLLIICSEELKVKRGRVGVIGLDLPFTGQRSRWSLQQIFPKEPFCRPCISKALIWPNNQRML